MTRFFRNSLLLFFVVILFGSCKKDLLEVDSNYEGEWHSAPVVTDLGTEVEQYFIIEGNEGVYGEFCELVPLGSNCGSYFSGEVRMNRKESKFYIGKTFEGGGRAIFRIDTPPHINSDGDWECTLTETVYIRN